MKKLLLLLTFIYIHSFGQSPTITVQPIDRYLYCAGGKIKIRFASTGSFQNNNTFSVEVSPWGQNNFSTWSSTKSGDTLILTLPSKVITQPNQSSVNFQFRISSSNPRVTSSLNELLMADKMTLQFSGEIEANLYDNITLTPTVIGTPPYTVTFSNGTTVPQVNYSIVVNPKTTSQTYTPVSVTNGCGVGTVSGSQKVNVQPIDLRISSTNLPYTFCKGGFFNVHYINSSAFNADNKFTVQCKSYSGTYQNCETWVENDSVLKVQMPINTTIENLSYLRVISSSPAINGRDFQVNSTLTARTAKLSLSPYSSNPSLNIEGKSVGTATYTFSNGDIYLGNSSTGINIPLPPTEIARNYSLVAAKDFCGDIPIEQSQTINVSSVNSKTIYIATTQLSVCKDSRTPITIPVFFEKNIDDNGNFSVEFSNSSDWQPQNSSILRANLSADRKNIVVDFPTEFFKNYERATSGYFLARVVSNNPKTASDYIPVYINTLPTASVCCDGTANTFGYSQIYATCTGGGPYKIELNDGTKAELYDHINAFSIEVSPKTTTDFTVKSISNACGNGTASKSIATIRVNSPTEFHINLDPKNPSSICAGESLDVYFDVTGKIPENTSYKVELFNRDQSAPNFLVVGKGNTSPIKIQIPSDINSLGQYSFQKFGKYIRVISDDGMVKSNSLPLNIKSLPVATLANSNMLVGSTTYLDMTFSGGEPFYYSFNNEPEKLVVSTDYTQRNITRENGYAYYYTTFQKAGTYKITSIRNQCGVGTFKTNLLKISPFSIELGQQQYNYNVCRDGVYPIWYNVVGSNENVNIKAQISDNSTTFSDLEIVKQGNPIWVRIPKSLQENSYTFRLKATDDEIYSPNFQRIIYAKPTVSMSTKNGEAVGLIDTYQTEYDCIKLQANTKYPWEVWVDNLPNKLDLTYSNACITVKPTVPTTYKIDKVVNICGFFDVPNNEVKVDFKPSITVNNNFIEACSGGNINFKFTTRGAFNANGNFSIYLIDNTNKEYTLKFLKEASYDGSLTLPSSLKEGYYNIMVKGLATNSQVINSNIQQVLIYPKPSAEIIDGSTIINSNRSVGIPFKNSFPNGTVNLILSDGRSIKVNGWGTEFSQKPSQTTVYELKSVANICGIEPGKGKFTVYVNPESSKKVDINASSREICAGESIGINFSVEGTIVKERLKLQLSDEKGENYKTIPTTYNATYNNLTGIIPADTKEGTNYRLKIFDPSDSEVQGSSTPYTFKIKPNFTVKITPTKPYYTDDASAEITLELSGVAPWSVIYGDSTGNNNRSVFVNKSPYILSLKPNNNVFYYKVFRVQSNTCASGVLSGTNPFLIELLTANSIEKPVANIYPNPTSDILELADEKTPKEIIIRNELGKHIKSISEQQDLETMKIEVSELPAGIYFIEIIHPEKTHKFKFVKL